MTNISMANYDIADNITHIAMPYAIQFRQLALKSPPLGPKWGRWAKKLGCTSDHPVCSLLVLEDRMRSRVFFAYLSHLGPSGGDFKASWRNCMCMCMRL